MRILRDELHAYFGSLPPCPQCGDQSPIGVIEPPAEAARWQHFAKNKCGKCGAFMGWLPWPTTDVEHKRDRRQSRRLLRPTTESFCEICLRGPDQLTHPDKLEVQHVVEKAEGGPDKPENLRIYCSACHSFVNWMRTYVSRREAAKRGTE
jgi:5-methylcytosine-specific restriction endonuclease McrA